MARKPSTRKRREPAPAASTRAEPAASNKRPTTKPGAACLERVLTRDATHFNLVAQLIDWCGCAAPLAALDATSRTCADAARTPVKLALTTATEANPLASLVRSHASRRKLSTAAAGRRLVVIEAADGAHANIGIEATEGGLYRPQAAPPGVCIVAKGTEDALADCGVLVLDTSKLGPASRARRVVRRLALATTARQGSEGQNRLHRELDALAWALDEMGRRTAAALDVPAGAARELILAVGAAAADLYRELGANVAYHNHPNASHAFCTDGCAPCNPCDYLGPPFINDCGYDLAGKLLEHAYGPLAPRTAPSPHAIWQLDQSRFFPPQKTEAEVGMDSRAYAYVPPACEGEKSAACKIHVAYHGCSSGVNSTHEGKRGLDIVRYAGYNGWAEANGIVVLYPQAYEDCCWNWDGNYVADGDRYDTRTSVQLVVVNAMVDAVAERLRDGDLRALRLGSLPTRSGPHYGPPPPRTYVSAAHSIT